MPKNNDKKAPRGQHGMADNVKKSGNDVTAPKKDATPVANSGKKDGVSNHSNFKSGGRPKK